MSQSTLVQTSKFSSSLHITSKLNDVQRKTNAKSHSKTKVQRKTNLRQILCNYSKETLTYNSSFGFCKCGRRHILNPTIVTTLLLLSFPSFALQPISYSMDTLNKIRPPKADWYEELYASLMNKCMKSYEAEIAAFKSELFGKLKGQAKDILEIGIGTGPNLKFYASENGVRVIGVDPNRKMEKYARKAAEAAGVSPQNFEFVHAVGEGLPVEDASVDAVIGTLVLCSVKDVDRTLQEVKRVLKPGGQYLFVEHVAAEQGTFRRFAQNILSPLQELLADNCHLSRDTGKYITEAGFSDVDSSVTSISSAFLVNPQVYGIARK